MTENVLGMVSGWMANGNINEFVKVHRDANRFELVSLPFEPLTPSFVADNCSASAVGRCREGVDPYAQSGNDPRGSQRRMSLRIQAPLPL